MEVIMCPNGHYYDKALGACPVCAAEKDGGGGARYSNIEDVPPTEPAERAGEDIGKTVPETDPDLGFSPTDFVPFGQKGGNPRGAGIEDYDPTQPDAMGDVEGFDPIVGWLICVKGPNRGKDYRLHNGTNFIGRSKEMDVCIENDNGISKTDAASITYDDRTKTFFIAKGRARNNIYVNGTAVRSDRDILIYDHLEIGKTELVFVPLCGENFTWQDN